MPEKIKVLVVVEDEEDIRLVIRLQLMADPRIEIMGEATTATAALDLVSTVKPGLIVLDHSIEGDVMGIQAAPLLKEAAPNAKILLFTAFDLRSEAKAEPAIDEFLSKSDLNKLLQTVQRLLGLEPLE